jgi:major membrane immunogen (membrane-anchored lipoprotein)
MNKVVAIIAIVSCVLVTACGPSHVQTQNASDGSIYINNRDGAGSITEVRLEDGTRCAVLIGYNKGGISCDWQGSSN